MRFRNSPASFGLILTTLHSLTVLLALLAQSAITYALTRLTTPRRPG